jgi:lysylphosphatidylglycerol synthetase-like protein (DUF2156 family)
MRETSVAGSDSAVRPFHRPITRLTSLALVSRRGASGMTGSRINSRRIEMLWTVLLIVVIVLVVLALVGRGRFSR